jgi:hypothetical protein
VTILNEQEPSPAELALSAAAVAFLLMLIYVIGSIPPSSI